MSFRRISIPAALILVMLLQFLPGTAFAPQPAAAAYCDSAQFIADVTIPDGTTLAPGAAFVKTWRLQNTGTCTWTTAYSIVFTGGDQMGAPAVVNMPGSVPPGGTVDLNVNMVAPTTPGHYRGNWKIRNDSGYLFGVGAGNYLFWVDIYVNGTYTTGTTYDFVANYCSALWASGAGGLACPGTDGNPGGFVMSQASPTLETGSPASTPGLLLNPQNVSGGYIKGFYPAYTVQPGDHFQTIVNCAYGATGCYVNFQLQYQIGGGTIHTFWSFNERYDGLYYPVNLDLSSLAGQSVNFILYMADVSGHGTPSGDHAEWVGSRISGAGGVVYPPIPPSSVCDRGAFVSDVTIPDGTVMAPGTAFTKTWRIRNVGSCTWTTSYSLVYAFGTLMSSATSYNLPSTVAPVLPGATADFSVNMVAPTTPGHYRSYWRFKNASGVQFGVGSGYITFFADIYVSPSVIGSNVSTTNITSDSPDPSAIAQSVPVSVTVTGSVGTPTGTVAITGADTNCTLVLSGGSGTCNVVFGSSGAKTLVATYNGDGNYAVSSDSESHTVSGASLASSVTTITADSPDPSDVAQAVAVSVNVTGSSGTPTGTVSLSGADTNCNITLSGGTGSCNVVFTSSGSKTITALYNGNSTYATSSDTESHTVNSAIPLTDADLTVSMVDGVTTYVQGGITTYIIEVNNTGPHDVVGASFSDNKPSQVDNWTWTCAADVGASCLGGPYSTSSNFSDTVNIPSGKHIVYSAVAHINASATGNIVNTAIVTPPGATPDPILGNNTATDTNALSTIIPGPQADLAVTKSNGGLVNYVPGGTVTYTIEVRNNGPQDVTAATFSDNKPVQVTSWSVTCLPAAGASCTAGPLSPVNITDSVNIPASSGVTYTVVANISASAVGNLVNTATITNPAAVPDPNLVNNSVTNTIAPPSADLAITKTDGITLWNPGGTTTYQVVVTNNGPLNVIGATFQDNKPVQVTSWSWTCAADTGASCTASGSGSGNISDTVNIPSTKKIVYTIVATLGTSVPGNLVNTATITAPVGMPDPILGNNSATDTDTGPTADLAVTKTDGVSMYTPGDTLTYTIRVTNNGPQSVIGATFADNIPAQIATWSWACVPDFSSTCTVGPVIPAGNYSDTINLAAGQGVTYTVTALVNGAATGNLVNSAAITAPGAIPDPVPGNNIATDTDAPPTADLAVTKTDGVSIYPPGGTVTYHIVVTNNGPADVTNAGVSDTRPGQVSSWIWTCVADSGAACEPGPVSPVNFSDLVDIPSGKKVTYTVVATINLAATLDMTNTVVVTAPVIVPDPIPGNNSASDTDAHPSADLTITKSDSVVTYTPGGNLIYTITVSNAGPSDVIGAVVSDSKQPQFNTWQWSCAADLGATCTVGPVGGGAVFNDVVDIPSGKQIVYTVTVALKGIASGTLTNVVTVNAPLPAYPDPNPVDNTASDIDTQAP